MCGGVASKILRVFINFTAPTMKTLEVFLYHVRSPMLPHPATTSEFPAKDVTNHKLGFLAVFMIFP